MNNNHIYLSKKIKLKLILYFFFNSKFFIKKYIMYIYIIANIINYKRLI